MLNEILDILWRATFRRCRIVYTFNSLLINIFSPMLCALPSPIRVPVLQNGEVAILPSFESNRINFESTEWDIRLANKSKPRSSVLWQPSDVDCRGNVPNDANVSFFSIDVLTSRNIVCPVGLLYNEVTPSSTYKLGMYGMKSHIGRMWSNWRHSVMFSGIKRLRFVNIRSE